jgi:hypothetical protein
MDGQTIGLIWGIAGGAIGILGGIGLPIAIIWGNKRLAQLNENSNSV